MAGRWTAQVRVMELMTLPFIVTEETGVGEACSGGSRGESWFLATKTASNQKRLLVVK